MRPSRRRDCDFLVSNNLDFHPTDVIEDADGSLLVIDTGGWYKLCCPTSQLDKPDVLGAIYRVRKVGAAKVDDPRGLKLDWEKPEVEELVEAARRIGRPAVRRRASEAVARLGRAPSRHDPARARQLARRRRPARTATECRLEAVWTLARIDGPRPREIDPDGARRPRRDRPPGRGPRGRALARCGAAVTTFPTPHGSTRRESPRGGRGLARIGAALVAGRRSSGLWTKPIGTSRPGTGRPIDARTRADLCPDRDGDPRRHPRPAPTSRAVRRAAMIALDQMGRRPARGASPSWPSWPRPSAANREAAAWVAGHHPEWGGPMARWFARAAPVEGADRGRAGRRSPTCSRSSRRPPRSAT